MSEAHQTVIPMIAYKDGIAALDWLAKGIRIRGTAAHARARRSAGPRRDGRRYGFDHAGDADARIRRSERASRALRARAGVVPSAVGRRRSSGLHRRCGRASRASRSCRSYHSLRTGSGAARPPLPRRGPGRSPLDVYGTLPGLSSSADGRSALSPAKPYGKGGQTAAPQHQVARLRHGSGGRRELRQDPDIIPGRAGESIEQDLPRDR